MKWIWISWVTITCTFSGYILWEHRSFSSKSVLTDSSGQPFASLFNAGKALLASRFDSLEDLKKIVDIRYETTYTLLNDTIYHAHLTYTTPYGLAKSHLSSGISQDDITAIKKGDLFDKFTFLIQYPFFASQRYQFLQTYHLSRRLHYIYGDGDVAFYDLALHTYRRILDKHSACHVAKDSSEKGYINTFNHVTGQAMITTLFSEETADVLSVLHERKTMIELTNGQFSNEQLNDPNNNPIDNYVDMINNEWGHEIGLLLRKKYRIDRYTVWSAKLLSDYMNDLCSYYCWSLNIRIQPFDQYDPLMIRFAKKLNRILEMKIPV